jgi:hypothetical protein
MRLVFSAAVMAATLCWGTVGCTSSVVNSQPASTRSLPDLPELPRVTTSAQVLETPVNQVFESQVELAEERDAYERLMSTCARAADHPFVPPGDYHPVVMFYDFALPFGPIEEARAKKYGYHDPLFGQGAHAPSWSGRVTPAWLTGIPTTGAIPVGVDQAAVPKGGCHAGAVAELGGDRPVAARAIAEQARSLAIKDPRWVAAREAWTTCMKDRGYPYAAPMDAVDAFANGRGRPTRKEIATAVADVRCKRSTREIDTIVGLLRAYESEAIAAHAVDFDAYARWKSRYLARVKRTLATTPPPPNRYWLTPYGRVKADPSDLGP